MTGFSPDPSNGPMANYGGGMLLPPIAQMAATDPRRLLVQSLLGQGQQALSHPMYSKFSALANALAGASGGFAATQLNKQYQGLNQDYLNEMSQRLAATNGQAVPPAGATPPVAPAAPPTAAGGPSLAPAPAPIQATPLPPMAPPQVALRQGDDSALPSGLIPSAAAASPPAGPSAGAAPDPLLATLERQSGIPSAKIAGLINAAEQQNGLPPGSMTRLIGTESSGISRPGPLLPNGQRASGYLQEIPDTAGRYNVTPGDLPSEINGMGQYLGDLTKRNGGNFAKALVDYGGFKTKSPLSYVSSVTGGAPSAPPGSQVAQAPPQAPASAQLAQTLIQGQGGQPQAPAGASGAPAGSDPFAAQMAYAQSLAQSPNMLVRYQGQQLQQQLLQGRALAFEKGYGETSGQNTANLDPTTGKAAQILQTAGPEAYAASLKQSGLTAQEVLKSLFTPTPNRGPAGGVSIPGNDPAVLAATAGAFPALRALLQLPNTTSGAPNAGPPPNAAAAPAGEVAAPKSPVPYGTKSPIDEVPTVKLPTGELPLRPGEIMPGRDPVAIDAAEHAINQAQEQYKETEERARGASMIHAQIANMRQQVTSGNVTPSMVTPVKYFISSAINAVAGPQAAQSVTGVLPEAGDVLSKEATQMGTQYARETEGARQAVAGINIALKANPQLSNSKEGFLKILDILDAGSKHDLAAQEYGNAWFQKQAQTGPSGHYLGFQAWMNQNHPPEEFISKAVPLDAPRLPSGPVDQTQLQPNVTYQSPRGPAIWTGRGFQLVPQ